MSFGVRHHITSVGTNNVTYIDVESSVRPASTAHLLFIAHVISLIWAEGYRVEDKVVVTISVQPRFYYLWRPMHFTAYSAAFPITNSARPSVTSRSTVKTRVVVKVSTSRSRDVFFKRLGMVSVSGKVWESLGLVSDWKPNISVSSLGLGPQRLVYKWTFNKTRKPCCRKETARCRSYIVFGLKFANDITTSTKLTS